MAKPQVVVAPVLMSKLSVNAPEFYPSSYSSNYTVSIHLFTATLILLEECGYYIIYQYACVLSVPQIKTRLY